MGRDNVCFRARVWLCAPKMADSGTQRHYGRDCRAVGAVLDLVTATALVNFGALVAFTFVNLSVFNHFWRRKGMNKSWKDHFHCC